MSITPPPLKPVDLNLKQIAVDEAPVRTRQIFSLAFPLFQHLGSRFTDEYSNRPPILTGLGSRQYFVHRGRERRFAGEKSFDRGRYWSVCRDPIGGGHPSDGGALMNELLAYHSYSSRCMVNCWDSQWEGDVHPAQPDIDVKLMRQLGALKLGSPDVPHTQITLTPQRMTDLLARNGFGDSDFIDEIILFNFHEVKKIRVFDMRTRAAIEWLLNIYVDLFFEIAERKQKEVNFIHTPGWTFKRPSDVLKHIAAPELGGGHPFLQALGYYLRKFECDGIIYPSARNNFYSTEAEGVVGDFFGWNFVDLEGAEFGSVDEFEDIVGPTLLQKVFIGFHADIDVDIDGGKTLIRSEGIAERNWERFRIMQECVICGGEPSQSDFASQAISLMDLEPAGPLSIDEYFGLLEAKNKTELKMTAEAVGKNEIPPDRLPIFAALSRNYLKEKGRIDQNEGEWDFIDRQIDSCLQPEASIAPREFVSHFAGTVFSAMNQQGMCEAIGSVDPDSNAAMVEYAKLFSLLAPGLSQPLTEADAWVIAVELRNSLRDEHGKQVDVPTKYVFAFLSKSIRG